jgi:hypothetical protein
MKCQQLENDLQSLSVMQGVRISSLTTTLEGDRVVVIVEIECRKYRFGTNYTTHRGVETFETSKRWQRRAALQIFSMYWNHKLGEIVI